MLFAPGGGDGAERVRQHEKHVMNEDQNTRGRTAAAARRADSAHSRMGN